MTDCILTIFGSIEELNYIEYVVQIIGLIITIITFLTIFMSVHYEENIVKIQRSKMEVKTIKDIEEARRKLIEYVYINNEANKRYESVLKIFDLVSFVVFAISTICTFIYCLYLQIGAQSLVWFTQIVFLITICCVSKKLHSNKKVVINDFFDYYKRDSLYNESLDLNPKIKIIIPNLSEKNTIRVNIPYYFYNFECILKMSNWNDCVEILVKGKAKQKVEEEDILEEDIIKETFEDPVKYIDNEKLIFLKINGEWKAFSTNENLVKDDNFKIIEITINKEVYYKQISNDAELKMNEQEDDTITILE